MTQQNFKNHTRLVPMFHYIAFLAVLFPFIIAIIRFIKALIAQSGRLEAAAMLSLVLAVMLALWFARSFSLKAQDRAIRSEVGLRYFIATGKALPDKLRMSQIIALRFAGDDEFTGLVDKAVEEQFSNKQIKMAIQNWRADHNRV